MAIKIVTGVPGSGKTYFVVREVVSKNYRFSKTYGEWVPKELKKKVTIITNIAGLKLPHIKLDDILQENNYKSHRNLFTLNGIKPVQEKYGYLVIIIDEAQGYFPRSFRDNPGTSNGEDNNNSVFYFFEKHRHEGIDIYLCAQLFGRLNPDIANLFEYHIHAVRRSFSIGGEFKFRVYLGGIEVSVIKFPFSKSIGAIYQTVQVEEELQGKKVHPYRKYMIWGSLLMIFLAVMISTFIYMFKNLAKTDDVAVSLPKFDNQGRKIITNPNLIKQQQASRVLLETRSPAGALKQDKSASEFKPVDAQPIEKNEKFVNIRTGGMWFDGKLVAIQIFENMYTQDTIPFSYNIDPDNRYVDVLVPSEILTEYNRPLPFIASTSKREKQPDMIGQTVESVQNQSMDTIKKINNFMD